MTSGIDSLAYGLLQALSFRPRNLQPLYGKLQFRAGERHEVLRVQHARSDFLRPSRGPSPLAHRMVVHIDNALAASCNAKWRCEGHEFCLLVGLALETNENDEHLNTHQPKVINGYVIKVLHGHGAECAIQPGLHFKFDAELQLVRVGDSVVGKLAEMEDSPFAHGSHGVHRR